MDQQPSSAAQPTRREAEPFFTKWVRRCRQTRWDTLAKPVDSSVCHGLMTVGHTVDSAAWWFITMERTCQAQLLADAADAFAVPRFDLITLHHANDLVCQRLYFDVATIARQLA